jgi:hypothetical protein
VATSGNYADLSGKPTNLSAFNNDVGYLTTETEPLFSAAVSSGISAPQISSWTAAFTTANNALPLAGGTMTGVLYVGTMTTVGQINFADGTVMTSSPVFVGGSGGDNLGDHIATMTLNMAGNNIDLNDAGDTAVITNSLGPVKVGAILNMNSFAITNVGSVDGYDVSAQFASVTADTGTLQGEVAAVKSDTGTLRTDLNAVIVSTGGLVKKSGDTMTGVLNVSTIRAVAQINDAAGNVLISANNNYINMGLLASATGFALFPNATGNPAFTLGGKTTSTGGDLRLYTISQANTNQLTAITMGSGSVNSSTTSINGVLRVYNNLQVYNGQIAPKDASTPINIAGFAGNSGNVFTVSTGAVNLASINGSGNLSVAGSITSGDGITASGNVTAGTTTVNGNLTVNGLITGTFAGKIISASTSVLTYDETVGNASFGDIPNVSVTFNVPVAPAIVFAYYTGGVKNASGTGFVEVRFNLDSDTATFGNNGLDGAASISAVSMVGTYPIASTGSHTIKVQKKAAAVNAGSMNNNLVIYVWQP